MLTIQFALPMSTDFLHGGEPRRSLRLLEFLDMRHQISIIMSLFPSGPAIWGRLMLLRCGQILSLILEKIILLGRLMIRSKRPGEDSSTRKELRSSLVPSEQLRILPQEVMIQFHAPLNWVTSFWETILTVLILIGRIMRR